ncbi:MAG: trehalase family glycosidase [Flavobacteriaceae bacterium]|nr:trehalase family glycosidase [Flavobacteriaceae bacterium]
MYRLQLWSILVITVFVFSCKKESKDDIEKFEALQWSKNVLDYKITPNSKHDKRGLMFSDQGAWFAYAMPSDTAAVGGFTGPYLMTQQYGIWGFESLSKWQITSEDGNTLMDWQKHMVSKTSWNSHLEQVYKNDNLEVRMQLVFASGQTAVQQLCIKNLSKYTKTILVHTSGKKLLESIHFEATNDAIQIHSTKSPATGYIQANNVEDIQADSLSYTLSFKKMVIEPQKETTISLAQHFVFPEYKNTAWKSWNQTAFDALLTNRKKEKNIQIQKLIDQKNIAVTDSLVPLVLAKAIGTLQNNWRLPAGEIKFEGLFPSYHYRGFNGFWSWDSWKHAVGLSYYNTDLAKKQVKQLFTFQNEDGFVADCVYREGGHNWRDTKPPLSAWAVATIMEKDTDIAFLEYMYPKLKSYHYWWYNKRDHDQDGLCEFGSTDGSLIAAKWESGMDNAIRFDNSKILQNGEGAYSIDQESVDLNAYLYAEKLYMADLAKQIGLTEDADRFVTDAEKLKANIQKQFYDAEDGWFYDTNLAGDVFIKGEGSEGWTALWANAATAEQAESVKSKMMMPEKFFTKVPFQTMSADHEKFNPLRGYWRGPNWLDQAYFGVKALKNYGYEKEAILATQKILDGAAGVKKSGVAIRENYHPITGEGLNAKNFSWSAAHLIMLLVNE